MPAGSVPLTCKPPSPSPNPIPPELPATTRPFAPEVLARDGLCFWFERVGPNYFGTHRHRQTQVAIGYGVRDAEFTWQEKGGKLVERRTGGDVIWILPSDTVHSLRLRNAAFWIVFYFDLKFDVTRDVAVRATLIPLSDYVRRDGLIGDLGVALQREQKAGRIENPGHVMKLGALLNSCLLRAHGRETIKSRQLLALSGEITESVRAFVQQHLREPLTLPVLARSVGMSADYFSRRLRLATGLSAEQFVLHERLSQARALLRTGSHSVGSVAEMCGFQSHAAFSKHFSVRFGRPPRSYLPGALKPLKTQDNDG